MLPSRGHVKLPSFLLQHPPAVGFSTELDTNNMLAARVIQTILKEVWWCPFLLKWQSMCQKGIKSESSTHYSRPPALTLVSCSCYQNIRILLMKSEPKSNNPWRFRRCKRKRTKRQLEAMWLMGGFPKKICCSYVFCPNYLRPLPAPPPQFGQLVQLFSDVEIQYLKVSLGLKILYINYTYIQLKKTILSSNYWHFGGK